MKHRLGRIIALMLPVFLFIPSLVSAHTGVGPTIGFWYGFIHPFSGLDHILAMVAVGIWAAQLGGKALWIVPSTFVSAMIVGGILGINGVALPFVEQGIIMSILILGVLIVAAARLPIGISTLLVGLFAIFHGHAHGTEMPLAMSGLRYGLGFISATILLHASGISLAVLLRKIQHSQVLRFAGVGIVMAGIVLSLS